MSSAQTVDSKTALVSQSRVTPGYLVRNMPGGESTAGKVTTGLEDAQ